jgi:outer membrane receptor protein involved in Fe transport
MAQFALKNAIWVVAAIPLLVTPPARRVGGVVDGVVTDSGLAPLAAVTVTILQTATAVQTGESGRFRITQFPAGRHILIVRRLGFEALSAVVDISENDTLRLAFTMYAVAVTLDTTHVAATSVLDRLAGFEERRKHEVGGKYITREDITKQNPVATTDLLRRVLGISVVDSVHVPIVISSRGLKIANVKGQLVPVQCIVPVGVDGFLKDSRFAINSIPPADIHGIEIYDGPASIPPLLNGGGADRYCGLVMIWTR